MESSHMSRYLNKQLVHETYRGRLDRVEKLLAQGAAINKLASDGFTPLMRAAYQGHGDLVRLLLERGADPNATAKDGASALFWACVRQNEKVAGLLIAAGADVNAVRDGNYSVLNAAIGNQGSLALVKALIQAGASSEHRFLGKDMLQYAEWCGRQDVVPLLKRKGPRRMRRCT
jgi:ankyrin repeat protein